METVKPSAVSTPKSKLARTFAKVLHLRTAVGGIVPDYDEVQKTKSGEKFEHEWSAEKTAKCLSQTFDKLDEELQRKMALEALAARIFASTSAIKASYAQLQYAQSPYDVEAIQAADQSVVSELKKLSELKQCFLKKQYDDPSPDQSMVLAEIQEQKSVAKTFEIMGKKLESQQKLKETEIILLRKKLEERNKQNKSMERRLGQSGQLSMLDNLHISGLSPTHFIQVLRHTVKSIRSFVRLMIDEMKSAEWNIDAAAKSVENNVIYWKADDKCYAFESFVCREMFDDFHRPCFSLPVEKKQQRVFFFEQFMELKTLKVKEYLSKCPRSVFAKFCRAKYLKLVHPKMEASIFGNLSVRNMVNSYEFPDTIFFALFAEMAKRAWLLHCLAFAFEPEASIFQVSKGCRFSEVYMESVADESLRTSDVQATDSELVVAFTVVPGFRIGKTVIQSQVYLSQLRSMVNR